VSAATAIAGPEVSTISSLQNRPREPRHLIENK